METQPMAYVMDIERFAIHDGPGIRTVVFLQGCPLHCTWCANPESQKIGRKLMHIQRKCVGCQACVKACPNRAIAFIGQYPQFDRQKCVGCGICGEHCLQDAIHFSGREMTVDDIMKVVQKDWDYYQNSGGGITISGGDPFVQFPALQEILCQSKKMGLHTALETCGQTKLSKVKEVTPLVDLFLFDIKHVDPDKFHQYTGGDLEQIFENLSYLAKVDPDKVIVRVPVIPTCNDDAQTLQAILQLVQEKGLKQVHLLPYHVLGVTKYQQLGLAYELPAEKSMPKEQLVPYQILGKELGLNVQIGG